MSSARLIQLTKVLRDPRILLSRIVMLEAVSKRLSDVTYLKWVYYLRTGKYLDLEHPKTFNEKIQWLKLHNTSDECTRSVDKYEVRQLIAEKIGEEYLIPMVGCWESFDEIHFDTLPDQFVLKCTHDSGSVVICRDKCTFNKEAAKAKLEAAMKHNFFWTGREYPYKNVKPRIICEQLMKDSKSDDLVDYKFFCFGGQPKILFYASDRFNKKKEPTKFDFYDMNLERLDISRPGHGHADTPLNEIPKFSEMKDIATKLSSGYPFVRIDLYLINDKIFFGEYTFHPSGGYVKFAPDVWDTTFGEWIKLPTDK